MPKKSELKTVRPTVMTSSAHALARTIEVNLIGPYLTCRALVPGMVSRGYGRIVNIASAHGLTASPFKSAYVAAKHGVVGLTKVVGLETATSNVTCNAICPGTVESPSLQQRLAAGGDYEGARAAYEAILHANPGDAEAAAAVKQMAFFARATRGEPGAIDRADAATGATGEEKVALALAAADEELLAGSPS